MKIYRPIINERNRKMVKFCPITNQLINEKVTRIVAFFTFIISVLFIFFNFSALFIFLTIDFIIRAFGKGDYSPFLILSVWISEKARMKPAMINAGPKIFAARIGSLLSAGAIITGFLGLPVAAMTFASILAFFAFLESVLGFCVACKLYPFVIKLGI